MSIETAISFHKGEDVTITDSIVDASSVAVDVTGWSLLFTIKRYFTDTATVLTKATGGSGITITNGPGGVCQIVLTSANTNALTADSTYVYDIQRTDSGSRAVLSLGYLTVKPEAGL